MIGAPSLSNVRALSGLTSRQFSPYLPTQIEFTSMMPRVPLIGVAMLAVTMTSTPTHFDDTEHHERDQQHCRGCLRCAAGFRRYNAKQSE
jgi:hypothetical protein